MGALSSAAEKKKRGEEIVAPPAAPAKDTGEEPLTRGQWVKGVVSQKGTGSSAKGTGGDTGAKPKEKTEEEPEAPKSPPKEAAPALVEEAKTVQEVQGEIYEKLLRVEDLRDQIKTEDPDKRVMLRGFLAKTDAEIAELRKKRSSLMDPGTAQAAPTGARERGAIPTVFDHLPDEWTPAHTKATAMAAPMLGLPGFIPEKVDHISELMTLEGAGQYAKEAAEFAKAGGEPARSQSAYFTPTPTSLSGPMTDLTPVATLKTTVDRVNKRRAEINTAMKGNREKISRAKAELKRLESSTTPDIFGVPGSMIAMPLTEKHRTAEAEKKEAEQWLKDLVYQNRLLADEKKQLKRIQTDMMARLAATSPSKGEDHGD